MTTNFAVEGSRIPQFTVGDRLKKARETAGLSSDQLASELGVTTRSLTRYERARTVKRSIVLAYAMRTGVPVKWLETGLPDLDSNQEPIDYRASAYPVAA